MAEIIQDVVGEFIRIKNEINRLEKSLKALDTIILASNELRADKRITIGKPRVTTTINEKGYTILELLGVDVEVVEKRRKTLNELDITARQEIEKNPIYFDVKTSKESILIAKAKEEK